MRLAHHQKSIHPAADNFAAYSFPSKRNIEKTAQDGLERLWISGQTGSGPHPSQYSERKYDQIIVAIFRNLCRNFESRQKMPTVEKGRQVI